MEWELLLKKFQNNIIMRKSQPISIILFVLQYCTFKNGYRVTFFMETFAVHFLTI